MDRVSERNWSRGDGPSGAGPCKALCLCCHLFAQSFRRNFLKLIIRKFVLTCRQMNCLHASPSLSISIASHGQSPATGGCLLWKMVRPCCCCSSTNSPRAHLSSRMSEFAIAVQLSRANGGIHCSSSDALTNKASLARPVWPLGNLLAQLAIPKNLSLESICHDQMAHYKHGSTPFGVTVSFRRVCVCTKIV